MDYPCGHSFEDCDMLGKACPICGSGKGKNKFGAVSVNCKEHGYFHSKGEYKRYLELVLLQRAGLIADLKRQVGFWIESIKQKVVWDYTYTEVDDNGRKKKIAEDFKGHRTKEYIHKLKWFKVEYRQWEFRETRAKTKGKQAKSQYQFGKRRSKSRD